MAAERLNAQQAGEPERSSARPASAMPSLGRGLNPATALALQRTAGNRALVQALQRYALKKYKHSSWRQSDDMTMATRDGYPNHELYAKPGKVAKSNTALRAVKSDIELVETAKEDTFWNDDKSVKVKLRKVEAKNKVNGSQGDSMLLWADCGRSASVVVGSLNRQAVFNDDGTRAVASGGPDEMKAGIMKTWLPKEKARKLKEKNTADAKLIDDALKNGGQREAELGPIATRWHNATTDVMKKAIAAEYSAKLAEMGRPTSPTSTPAPAPSAAGSPRSSASTGSRGRPSARGTRRRAAARPCRARRRRGTSTGRAWSCRATTATTTS